MVMLKSWVALETERAVRKVSRLTGKTCSAIVREAVIAYVSKT
jgi:hypothetical protein